MNLVADLTLLLLAALAGGFLARRLGQPLMLGYLLAGAVVGPHTGGFAVATAHEIEAMSEIGVAMLLFSLGLELSIRELAPVRAVALGGTTIQLALTAAVGLALGLAFGWPWRPSLWFGAALAVSSTMVALKTVQAQGRLGTLSSRVMLAILVVQDLAVVPLMIVLPALSDETGSVTKVVVACLRAALLLAVIVFVATRVVPRLMSLVARWNSRELFLLTTTAVALGVGYATWAFGLSLAVGAFVAGLVISESEYAHQALSDVVPLRDLFGTLFFVSVGMLLDPAVVARQAGTLAVVVLVVVVGKALILGGVVRAFGYVRVVPIAVGLTLFQVGEFAFVLATVGRTIGAIPEDVYVLVLNTAVVTMLLTPVVSGLTPWIYERVRPRASREQFEAINLPAAGLSGHVVVAGAGRVGRSIADALGHLQLPCVLVEFDERRIRQARAAGLPVIYGDASQPIVLEAAGVGGARALLVTVPSYLDVRNIILAARHLRDDLPIIARADSREAIENLYALGVEEVASPEFEAGIEMTRQALVHLDVPAHDILRVANAVRRERYGLSSELDVPADIAPLGEITRQLDFAWLRLPEGSPLAGHSIGELQIRSRIGAAIAGLVRHGTFVANPGGEARLDAGDLVAVLGTRDQIARFEQAMAAVTPLGGPLGIAQGPVNVSS